MTADMFRENAIQVARVITIAPVLFAALLGAIPLIIPCIACRCCKGIAAQVIKAIQK